MSESLSWSGMFVIIVIALAVGFFVGIIADYDNCPSLLTVYFGRGNTVSVANFSEALKMCDAVGGQLFCGPSCTCVFNVGEPYE